MKKNNNAIAVFILITLSAGSIFLVYASSTKEITPESKYRADKGYEYSFQVTCDLDCTESGYNHSTGVWNSWNGATSCYCDNGADQILIWVYSEYACPIFDLDERIMEMK